MRWEPAEPAWQYEVLDRLPCGIDSAQLDEALGGGAAEPRRVGPA
jgi:hypothetical protein